MTFHVLPYAIFFRVCIFVSYVIRWINGIEILKDVTSYLWSSWNHVYKYMLLNKHNSMKYRYRNTGFQSLDFLKGQDLEPSVHGSVTE